MKRRFEISASGIDNALQGISSDPFGQSGTPQAAGLRIPPVLPSDTGPTTRPRYLFCLATRRMVKPCRLIGVRQGLTIGCDINVLTGPPLKIIELNVTTPNFQFTDGNVSWHLVREPNGRPTQRRPATDTNNWAFDFSDDAAMLYESFANSSTTPSGAPFFYFEGLTAYVPPQVTGRFKPVEEDLFNFPDIRFRWDSDHAWSSVNIDLNENDRISLYASVLQTNPATRVNPVTTNPPPFGTPPEQAFIAAYSQAAAGEEPATGPEYWRVFGALMFEDEI